MNALEHLEAELRQALVGVEIALDRPSAVEGRWFLDAQLEGHGVTVEWRPTWGFGVTASPHAAYGEGPEEVFEGVEEALARVVELLQRRGRTRPPPAVLLRNLREEVAAASADAAPAVEVLRRAVEAMGGELEVIARFPEGEVRLEGRAQDAQARTGS